MPRTKYTEAERAAAYVALKANNWNVARSAKDVNIPENTVRDWARVWEKEPPQFDQELLQQTNEMFVDRAERLRDKLLFLYEQAVDKGEVKADKYPVALAILDDKIRLHRGLATTRTESKVALPSAEEVRGLFRELAQSAVADIELREQDIIEADLDEQSPKELVSNS